MNGSCPAASVEKLIYKTERVHSMSETGAFGVTLLKYHEPKDFGVRLVFYPEHAASDVNPVRCGEHVDTSTRAELRDIGTRFDSTRAARGEDAGGAARMGR